MRKQPISRSGWRRFVPVLLATSLVGAPTAAGAHVSRPTRPYINAPDAAIAYGVFVRHDATQIMAPTPPPLVNKWSKNLGGPVSYPLISNGKVYVTVADHGSIGSTLYALNQVGGSIAWSSVIKGSNSWSTPAFDNGFVYALNYDGVLQGFNADTGNRIFRVQLTGATQFSSPPTAMQHLVYVAGSTGSGSGTVYAVNGNNGHVKWSQPVNDGQYSGVAVSDGIVFVSYACGEAYAFDFTTGLPKWHALPVACSHLGAGGTTPVFHDSLLYVRDPLTTPNDGFVLSKTTGSVLSRFAADPLPVLEGHQFAYYLSGGKLRAKNVTTGQTLWTFTGDHTLASNPVLVNGTDLWIGGTSGNLYALNASTGGLEQTIPVGSPIGAPQEQSVARPLTGITAGQGLLVIPAGNVLAVYGT
jgi:outer membrane protein assembly factor BamB